MRAGGVGTLYSLTADTAWPNSGFCPGPVRQAGHVDMLHLSLSLEEETFLLTLIADIMTELHRVSRPDELQMGLWWWQGRVDTLHPDWSNILVSRQIVRETSCLPQGSRLSSSVQDVFQLHCIILSSYVPLALTSGL